MHYQLIPLRSSDSEQKSIAKATEKKKNLSEGQQEQVNVHDESMHVPLETSSAI